MPTSVRWLGLLVALAIVGAALSLGGVYWETARQTRITAEALTGGHVDAGRATLGRYGCGACHVIAGVHAAVGTVGPKLDGVATRAELAGVLRNEPAEMMRWLRHPQQVLPGNGMPELGVTELDARDIAAYLYTLKS